MQRTVFDLKVDSANISRQISEKELEISVLKSKLAELKVEYGRAVESNTVVQRDEAHAKIRQEQEEMKRQQEDVKSVEKPTVEKADS